jgi:hypothetical protein
MKMKSQRTGLVLGVIAACTVCGKEFQDYKTARRQAASHARSTGHLVAGEVTRYFEYGRIQGAKTTSKGD